MGDAKAFICIEDYENQARVIFAKSNIAARKTAANIFDMDGIAGLSVARAPGLDKYEHSGVPAWLLVADGWRFECFGCGAGISEDELDFAGLRVEGVVGTESGRIYCNHQCRMQGMSKQAAADALGEGFIDMLKDRVRARFPDFEHDFGSYRHHAYVPQYQSPMVINQAQVKFSFPGMTRGPASIRYETCGARGETLIGPNRLELFCPNGDRAAFESASLPEVKP